MRSVDLTRAFVGAVMLTAAALVSAGGHPQADSAAQSNVSVDSDGIVHVPAFDMPLSSYMSEEGRRAYLERRLDTPPLHPGTGIAAIREQVDRVFGTPLLTRARERYPVIIEARRIAGVRTDVVTPQGGVSQANRDRVLLNLHGGGFSIGAGIGGLIESVPIAAVGNITVISVDYRQGPENKFPAAREDVAAFYRELLRRYEPANIGIYGCSAGGMLTAMSMAWFQREKLPDPGAIGIFCAGADPAAGGDSRFTGAPLNPLGGARELPPPAKTDPRQSPI